MRNGETRKGGILPEILLLMEQCDALPLRPFLHLCRQFSALLTRYFGLTGAMFPFTTRPVGGEGGLGTTLSRTNRPAGGGGGGGGAGLFSFAMWLFPVVLQSDIYWLCYKHFSRGFDFTLVQITEVEG